MKKISLLFATALLFGSYPLLLIAQDGPSLIEKLDRVTSEKEPQWKLDRKLPTDTLVVLRWSSGEERVFMSITLAGSPGKAKEIYHNSVARMNDQLGSKGTRSTVPNLGAENQLWTGHNDDGSTAMQFRQDKVHVLLFAPSEDVAKRFGRYVADLLPGPKAPQAESNAQAWKEYSSVEGGFSILFPGTPSQETQVIEAAPGVRFTLHIHKLTTLAECSVMYADYPISVSDPAVAKSVLDNGAKGAVAAVNAELLELKEITLYGHPGRYLKERMPSGAIMRVNMVLVGQRLYQVAITTPPEEGKATETVKTYEKMADKFLSSLKLLGKR
ncbi:MAG: hypothetical protein H7Z16_05420 [Pyrinomonadaceae bacterium]|nr:hypothetical protein [Pyrinomonadaceae bacterium]